MLKSVDHSYGLMFGEIFAIHLLYRVDLGEKENTHHSHWMSAWLLALKVRGDAQALGLSFA
jgi:hypothetical protein